MTSRFLKSVKKKTELKGDEALHEKTDAWSNRDLIPLPPARRTWGWFNYFGFWGITSINITNWQQPNTYLTQGLSVGQAMLIIVISRALTAAFSTLIAWCGLKWHVGFTIQNRFTWGMRGSYIPLIQRVMLNFLWVALQCWNGGRLTAVCVTAIWPSFNNIKNTFPASFPATTNEFIGFFLFWSFSLPFIFIRPEKFKLPYRILTVYCSIGFMAMMIWSLAVAKGVGPVFSQGESKSADSKWSTSWIIMYCINQLVGGTTPGMTNGSDFSRYSKGPKHYVFGSVLSLWVVGVLISFMGLVTTSACQKIYGEVYWNPPDLMLVMMDNGKGSSKSRAAVFFLSASFALAGMFENISGNAFAGGIDLAGLFPRYIDVRRGTLITFVACWAFQPWQLINRATTFITVISSFSIFLAPLMGIMCADFFLLRRQKIQLSHLYRTKDSVYWYWHGINWRVFPAWLAGWAPTVGGLIVTVRGDTNANRGLFELYYVSMFYGFFVSGALYYITVRVFPVDHLGQYDETDYYGTFTAREAEALGVSRLGSHETLETGGTVEQLKEVENGLRPEIVAEEVY